MTPESAAALLRRMLHPLIQTPGGPTQLGVRLSVKGRKIVIVGSPEVMGRIIGGEGIMIKSARILFAVFGIEVNAAEFAEKNVESPVPDGPLTVQALTEEYLTAWVGDGWTKKPETDIRAVFAVPVGKYTHELDQALNTWAYRAGQANGQRIKFRLEQP